MSWVDILKQEEFLGPMTQDSAVELWNKYNPDEKYNRRDGAYALTDWFLRVINGKVVGIQGFSDYGDYAFVGGTNSVSRGGTKAFEKNRKNYLGTKPKVAGFKAGKGKTESWVETLKDRGWTINPNEFEDVPAEIIQEFKNNYGGNWGIKKMRS